MKPGILRWGGAEATIGPEGGWQCENAAIARMLQLDYPPPSTPAGVPWVVAFWKAVEGLGADVVQEPVPARMPPGTIY